MRGRKEVFTAMGGRSGVSRSERGAGARAQTRTMTIEGSVMLALGD